MSIALPHGWVVREAIDAESLDLYHPTVDCGLAIIPEAKDDFEDDVTLATYAGFSWDTLAGDEAVAPEPFRDVRVDDLPGLQTELRIEVDGLDLTYVLTVLESETHFFQISAWTSTSTFELGPDYVRNLATGLRAKR